MNVLNTLLLTDGIILLFILLSQAIVLQKGINKYIRLKVLV